MNSKAKGIIIHILFPIIFSIHSISCQSNSLQSPISILPVCESIADQQFNPRQFRLPLKYRHYGECWRQNSSSARLFSSPQLDSNFGAALNLFVQGTNSTVIEIIKILRSRHCLPFIWGGAVRDLALGILPSDVDMAVTCSPARLKQICLEWWGPSKCQRPHRGSLKLSIGNEEGNKGIEMTEPIDIAHWNNSFEANDGIFWEYSIDTMAYYLTKPWEGIGGNVLLDLSGRALDDVCNRRIRVPTKRQNWEEWAAENPPLKLLRHWTLRAKGFWSDWETREFVVQKTRQLVGEEHFWEFFCRKVLEGKWMDGNCQKEQRGRKHPFVQRFIRHLKEDMGRNLSGIWPNWDKLLGEE